MNDLNIKDIRHQLGLSQNEFAKKIGVTLRTIQNWEAGGTIPKSKYELLRNITKISVMQTGSGNNNQQGKNNIYTSPTALEKAIDEISEQRKLVAKSQEQIDRLIGLLEKNNGI